MEHSGSRGTYDYISKWISPDFFFSVNDKWDRFGMLGVFGDYVLSCTQGDIFEIGVGESSIYLTALAKKYNRRIYHCDISASKIINPMTIKGYLSEDPYYMAESAEFRVDKQCLLFAGASDEFFKKVNLTPIALGFIDGNHRYEQVRKDFDNIAPFVVDNGFIILHDGYPPSEDYIDENLCGNVYKLRQEIEQDKSFDCLTLTRGTAMGVGLTIIRKKPKDRNYYNE